MNSRDMAIVLTYYGALLVGEVDSDCAAGLGVSNFAVI